MNSLRIANFGDRNKPEVSLTFDDGPNPYFTSKVLDILGNFDVKATFFVIGKRCEEHPNILREIENRGHLIANHTFSHQNGDFERCGSVIAKILHKLPCYVRPPFYDLSFCIKEKSYLQDKFIIRGDVDSKDYLPISRDEVIANVVSNTMNGSIIDFHDGSEIDTDLDIRPQKTLDALPEIIALLQTEKFNLVRIDEMSLSIEDNHLL